MPRLGGHSRISHRQLAAKSIKPARFGAANYENMARIAPSSATISDSAYANKAPLTEENSMNDATLIAWHGRCISGTATLEDLG